MRFTVGRLGTAICALTAVVAVAGCGSSSSSSSSGKGAVTVLVYPDQNGVNLALQSGRAQLAMADSPVAAYAVKQSNGMFKLVGQTYGTAPYGLALPKGNGMTTPVLAAVKALMANGTYKAILTKWGVESGAITNPTINGVSSSSTSSTSSSSSGSSTTSGTPATGTIASVAALVPASVKSKGTFTVAADASYAPNEFVASDGHTVQGMDADLAKALGAAMGLKVAVVNQTFDSIIPGLAAGKYDMGASSFTDNKAREKVVDFVTYFSAGTSFYTKAQGGTSVSTLADLCGHTVAVEKGTTQQIDATAQGVKCKAAGATS